MRFNRRVVVSVFYEKAEKVNMRQLFENLVPETIVKWDATNDTIVYGLEGTILHFPKGALAPCASCNYEIRIREIYDPGAMYLASLTTTSFQHFLRSDGMLEVRAYKNGNLVKESPLKPFSVLMPTDSLDSEMKLFYGSKTSTGIVNWHSPSPVSGISNSSGSENALSMTNLGGLAVGKYRISIWDLKNFFIRDARKKRRSSGYVRDDVSGYTERKGKRKNTLRLTPDEIAKLNINRADVDYYSFQSTRWEYMNMDAYMKLPASQRVDMKVLTDVSGNKAVKAMFTGSMSLIPEKLVRDGFVFETLPKNQNITLVATEVKNGYAYLAVKSVTAANEYKDDFVYEKHELKDLRKALNKKLVWTPLRLSSGSSPQ